MSVATPRAKSTLKEVLFKIIENGSRVEHRRVIAGVVPRKTVAVPSAVTLKIPSVCRFTDEKGQPVHLRYLADCPEIDYNKQIAKDGLYTIAPNRKFTKQDRKDLAFYRNILVAKKPHLIEYLEKCTYNAAWTGESKEDDRIYFEKYTPVEDKKKDLKFGFRQARAVSIIQDLSDEGKGDELDSKIIAIYGSHFEIPEELDDKASLLIEAVNDATADTDEALDVIEEKKTKGDTVPQIIAKAVAAKILSFDRDGKAVMINKEGKKAAKWEVLRSIPEEYTLEQKITQVEAWLTMPDGQLTLESIKTYLGTTKKE